MEYHTGVYPDRSIATVDLDPVEWNPGSGVRDVGRGTSGLQNVLFGFCPVGTTTKRVAAVESVSVEPGDVR
ncbi:MAG TPA: hypothetical protein VD866_04695 [Urbifossiella sp.]|nr:hypothetical protein [Urbifossiella sp.]